MLEPSFFPRRTVEPDAAETDIALAERLRVGDPDAFDTLVRRYWPRLLDYATRVLGNHACADDVVQEAFIRVWQHRDELRVATSVLPYLYRVVRNLAVDERRKQATQRRWFEGSPPEHRSPPTPLEVLEADETRSATERAIAQLPPRRREVFVLAHQNDLTYRQIADIMAISPQTVANHLSAALSDLREALGAVVTEQMDPANH